MSKKEKDKEVPSAKTQQVSAEADTKIDIEGQSVETEDSSATLDVDKTEESKKEEDYKSKYYYLAAEMDNLRKRFEKQKEEIIKYGSEKILSSMLAVLDNFDHAIKAIDKNEEKLVPILEGIEMVKKGFLDVLKDNGLLEVVSTGEFDPRFHDALSYKKSDLEENTILEVIQKGYTLNGRLLRPAKVIIAKGV